MPRKAEITIRVTLRIPRSTPQKWLDRAALTFQRLITERCEDAHASVVHTQRHVRTWYDAS